MFRLRVAYRSLPPGLKRLAFASAAVPTLVVGTGIAQGMSLLIDYRRNHRDAPEPMSPACGAVAVCSRDDDTVISNQKPLRLLVVGDSLAVGVGCLTASPILPESISRALSKALGGRPVQWTCIGTSGASANRIVEDIQKYHSNQNQSKDTRVQKSIFAEGSKSLTNERPVYIRKIKNWPTNWTRQRSLDETSFKECDYDVAVVLTGLNDVKNATLPSLLTDNLEGDKDQKPQSSGFEAELTRILHVLKDKMDKSRQFKNNKSDSSQTKESNTTHMTITDGLGSSLSPLIVLPALPVTLAPVFQCRPLTWFLLPLLSYVDNHKRSLSLLHPDSVLFVASPHESALSQYRTDATCSKQGEKELFLARNIGLKAKKKVEAAMSKYYEVKERIISYESKEREVERQYEQAYHQHGLDMTDMLIDSPSSNLFSPDGIHPNNDGYDLYARHIAASIVSEWKRRTEINI